MGFLRDRIGGWLRSRLGIHQVHGFVVAVDNTRADIATDDVIARLRDALALVDRYQPWRLAHLRRDLTHIRVMRFPCRGAYFPENRACMVELTFLARRDIGPETVASTIVHEGIHARVHRWRARRMDGAEPADRDRSREERLCRRAELDFGLALPPELGAVVVERARESLAMADQEVAPDIDWQEALRRQNAIDAGRAP